MDDLVYLKVAGGSLTLFGVVLLLMLLLKGDAATTRTGFGKFVFEGPAGVLVLILGLAVGGLGFAPEIKAVFEGEPAPFSSTESPSPPASTPPVTTQPPEQPSVRILAPAQSLGVSSEEGTVVSGTVTGDGDIWVFVEAHRPDGEAMVLYRMDEHPVGVTDGRWSTLVKPIGGGQDDIGLLFTIVVLLVDRICNNDIANYPPAADGETYFDSVNAVCSNVLAEAKVAVVVDRA